MTEYPFFELKSLRRRHATTWYILSYLIAVSINPLKLEIYMKWGFNGGSNYAKELY